MRMSKPQTETRKKPSLPPVAMTENKVFQLRSNGAGECLMCVYYHEEPLFEIPYRRPAGPAWGNPMHCFVRLILRENVRICIKLVYSATFIEELRLQSTESFRIVRRGLSVLLLWRSVLSPEISVDPFARSLGSL